MATRERKAGRVIVNTTGVSEEDAAVLISGLQEVFSEAEVVHSQAPRSEEEQVLDVSVKSSTERVREAHATAKREASHVIVHKTKGYEKKLDPANDPPLAFWLANGFRLKGEEE